MQTPAPSTRRTSLGAVALSATLGAVAGFAIGGIIVPPASSQTAAATSQVARTSTLDVLAPQETASAAVTPLSPAAKRWTVGESLQAEVIKVPLSENKAVLCVVFPTQDGYANASGISCDWEHVHNRQVANYYAP
jgi:hypothetical protein